MFLLRINKHCLVWQNFQMHIASFIYFFYYNKNVFCIKPIVVKKLSPEICQHGFFSIKWEKKVLLF